MWGREVKLFLWGPTSPQCLAECDYFKRQVYIFLHWSYIGKTATYPVAAASRLNAPKGHLTSVLMSAWICLMLHCIALHCIACPCCGGTSLQYSAYVLYTVCSPNGSDWWRASRFLPSWRISEWGLRWTLRKAFPRHSCSHHCCFCWQSSRNIFPRRFPSLWHISWLVSPPSCSRQPSRSLHPGDSDTGGGKKRRYWVELRTNVSFVRRLLPLFGVLGGLKWPRQDWSTTPRR